MVKLQLTYFLVNKPLFMARKVKYILNYPISISLKGIRSFKNENLKKKSKFGNLLVLKIQLF